MATNGTVLCIHRDPAQLGLLQENGYELVTATNGRDGLRLFASRPVDAVVLAFELGFLNGAAVAAEIKKVNPQVPIVMLADNEELPDHAFKSVDALVVKSDGPHLLSATLHFILSVEAAQRREGKPRAQMPAHLRRSRSRARQTVDRPTLLN
jgi:DNA-binding response OmpR family regulator